MGDALSLAKHDAMTALYNLANVEFADKGI